MPLVSGATAAGFCIVRQLEYAEFGELYAAEHPRLPRLQLLQLIPADISADLDYREDFNQQSDLAATLWHPNILGLTDRGEFEDQLWLSTDYLEGSDAAQLLGDSHPDGMPRKLLIEIVSAIAEALDYAHDRGVLHRYVNPGNILVSKAPADKRRIALAGFGVARPVSDKTNTLTRPGVIIGTASYTAPERLVDEAVDGRADQYGLAASAFHLLTGSPPFAHFNPAVVMGKHLNERPPRPSDFRPDLTEFDAIFARALSQDPVDRFRRCRDFARALELNGGKRSHVRATTDFLASSDDQESDGTAVTPTNNGAAPTGNGVAPTEPAALARPVAETARAVAVPEAPRESPADVVTTSAAAAPDDDIDDFDADDHYDEESDAARRRRKKQTAAIAGIILVVVLAWFVGVRALRSASQSDDAPTSVETTSAEATVATPTPVAPPPPPAPVLAPPPPVVSTPPPVTTSKVTPQATTTPTTPTRTTAPQTTRATTTSPKPATTTPSGLDTRPALGMPCGPDQNGAAAVSNSGGPVNCVSTPGGFAWEPPGVQPEG